MTAQATGIREMKSWEESTYSEVEGGPKLTRSSIEYRFTGDIEGDAKLEYLMVYHSETSTSFVGYEQVVGQIAERSGSFVLQHTGTVDDVAAQVSWSVVTGSGTGDLAGLRGSGGFVAVHEDAGNAKYTLDYDIE